MASARRWDSDSHGFQWFQPLDRRSEETSSSQRPRCTDPGVCPSDLGSLGSTAGALSCRSWPETSKADLSQTGDNWYLRLHRVACGSIWRICPQCAKTAGGWIRSKCQRSLGGELFQTPHQKPVCWMMFQDDVYQDHKKMIRLQPSARLLV